MAATTPPQPNQPAVAVPQTQVVLSNLRQQGATLFAQNSVLPLTELDFELDTNHPITIKQKECALILFYTENQESRDLAQIWSLVAQVAPGPSYYAVNMLLYPRIASAFTQIGAVNSSLRPFELKGYPFILSYQNGWPVAFYNGERSVGTLADWAMTLACRASYYEPIQLAGGVQVNDDFQMGGWTEYTPPRQTSLQYTIGNPIRRFNEGSGVNLITTEQRAAEQPTIESGGPASELPTPSSALPAPSEGVIAPAAGATT